MSFRTTPPNQKLHSVEFQETWLWVDRIWAFLFFVIQILAIYWRCASSSNANNEMKYRCLPVLLIVFIYLQNSTTFIISSTLCQKFVAVHNKLINPLDTCEINVLSSSTIQISPSKNGSMITKHLDFKELSSILNYYKFSHSCSSLDKEVISGWICPSHIRFIMLKIKGTKPIPKTWSNEVTTTCYLFFSFESVDGQWLEKDSIDIYLFHFGMAIEGWRLEVDEDKLFVHPKVKSMPIE